MKNPKKLHIFFLLTIILIGNVLFFTFRVRPTIKEYCSIEVQSVIRNIINNANETVLSKKMPYETLFTVKEDSANEVCYVSANTGLINQISMLWATEIQKGLDSQKYIAIKRPMGALTGSAWLAQFGREVQLEVNYTSTSRTEYQSVFYARGVNQTLHRLYLTAIVEAKIITPFVSENVVVDETYLFSEAILNGKVPGTYISASNYLDYLDLLD